MDKTTFSKLEILNSQIDIWIDEEEYQKVEDVFKIKKAHKLNLGKAFEHRTCTANYDDVWMKILGESTMNPFDFVQGITGAKLENWAPFFWGKLIRAKIQRKGTDCYFRRLDEVIFYLEHHLPIVRLDLPPDENYDSRLTVIFLLEMAAAGAGVDLRSFAERARRILKTVFRSPQDKSYIFYDLAARYTRAVGYFHDSSYRKAVLDFNYIIAELKVKSNDEFFKVRKACELLYLPSILYRADIQNELQLAYHALDTLSSKKFRGVSPGISKYKANKARLIRAEAYQQMSQWEDAWKELSKIAKELSFELKSYKKGIVDIIARPGETCSNLKSKLQSLVAVQHLSYLKKDELKKSEFVNYLGLLSGFLDEYKESSLCQEPNRTGYLKEIADLLIWLIKQHEKTVKTDRDLAQTIRTIVQTLFDSNKDDLAIKSERKHPVCSCDNKSISLWGLKSEEYKVFYDDMLSFFDKAAEHIDGIDKYKKDFIKNLKKYEEKKDKLGWRIRKFDLSSKDENEKAHENWFSNGCLACIEQSEEDATFDGLLECAETKLNCMNKNKLDKLGYLNNGDYETIMNAWDIHFLDHLKQHTFHTPYKRSLHFLGLQRWNSTSPAQGRSLGGGYFIYHTRDDGRIDLGVAIDPGFDFVRNLFHAGYSMADIDIVILSHAHVDHVRDFESMISLLFELKKRDKTKLKLHAIMTLGVYKRLEFLIESPGLREFIEPYIVDIEKEINNKYPARLLSFDFYQLSRNATSPSMNERLRFSTKRKGKRDLKISIKPILSYHDDHTGYSDTFGFTLHIIDKKSSFENTIVYTSDTSWHRDIKKTYFDKTFDVLLIHLGSLIDRDEEERKKFSFYKEDCEGCFQLVKEKNHPYLMGMLHFLNDIKSTTGIDQKPLVLLSEFGEEMRGGIRLDFCRRIRNAHKDINVLPIDVGLDIMLSPRYNEEKPTVRCTKCDDFVPVLKADFETYGYDEALFCVCKTCLKSTPHNVLQDRLRDLYEVGRELRYFRKDERHN